MKRKESVLEKWKMITSLILMSACITTIAKDHYTIPANKDKNLPFSEGVRAGNTVYLSGQIGIPAGESALVSGGIEAETKQIFTNIGLVLKHYSLDYNDIVRCLVMMADITEWPKFNEVYKNYFTSPFPARSAFATNGLAFAARVEVECTARISE